MGMNLTAHVKNEETGIFDFAPMDNFTSKTLFADDVPSFKMDNRTHHFLVAIVGPDFQLQTYKEGMYDFTPEEVKKTFFKISKNAFEYEEWGMPMWLYKEVMDFFQTCVEHDYYISVG